MTMRKVYETYQKRTEWKKICKQVKGLLKDPFTDLEEAETLRMALYELIPEETYKGDLGQRVIGEEEDLTWE